MKKVLVVVMAAVLTLGCAGCGKDSKAEKASITISSASSLKEALSDIQPLFEKEKGIKLNLNIESSGTLQKQIEEGAPVDVFFSAAQKQMDELEKENMIDRDSRKNLFENTLVFIVSNEYKDKIKTISDIVNSNTKMSIGTPESVPAGEYAKETLKYLDLWDKLTDKIVYAKNVKHVATYVDRGEVGAGIVYKSDATTLKDSAIMEVFEDDSHKPIVYPGAVVSASENKESAKIFLNYISDNSEVKEIFEKYGFKSCSR